MLKNGRAIGAVCVFALAIGALGAACSDDDGDGGGEPVASQASVDDLNARFAENGMLNSVVTLDGIPLHVIDDTLNDEERIDPEFVPDVRTFVRVISLTDWDASLEEDAEAVRLAGVELLTALEDGDVEAAKAPATAVHEQGHEFIEAAWNFVAKDLPPDEGGPDEHEEEEGAETPEPGTTPETEATP